MANQNLFEKYGIKEVADVTLYRIEKVEETYESQRKMTVSSILKGAVELQTVYPLTADGTGDVNGFEAYVFKDADIIKGINYDCDDTLSVIANVTFKVEASETETAQDYITKVSYSVNGTEKEEAIAVVEPSTSATVDTIVEKALYFEEDSLKEKTLEDIVEEYGLSASVEAPATYLNSVTETVEGLGGATTTVTYWVYKANFKLTFESTGEIGTGITGSTNDPDANKVPGTHEYTYAEQVLMLFAKNQNLISKSGVRYSFADAENMFGEIIFDDNFAIAPASDSRVVVVGLPEKFTESTYDKKEIYEYINSLKKTYSAKAFNAVYSNYAELIVEDEMGFFKPSSLGRAYTKNIDGTGTVSRWIVDEINKDDLDVAIKNAQTWGTEHYSINDAIDALRQKRLSLDANKDNSSKGVKDIFGGYTVQEDNVIKADYDANHPDYQYTLKYGTKTFGTHPFYSLQSVLDALAELSFEEDAIGASVRVEAADGKESNRAIYVNVGDTAETSARAYIYLLTNKNSKRLSTDADGIFSFEDNNGNTLYYQDKIFAGKEHLALVVIGKMGMIFVVNRCGNRLIEKIAWMVNENGYITNDQAKRVVKNGVIHTIDVMVNDETFDATCTLKELTIRKTKKKVNRYIPVLFLDTLKVSTIEQTAEQTEARGGKGNAQLIIWDYNKEITISLEDALYSPASMSAMIGSYDGNDFTKGVKETKKIDRTEKCIAKRSFIVPAGNSKGVPSEGELTAQAVYIDLSTMQPYQDGAPIAEGEVYLKWTRSIAYNDNSIGNTIEISADKFPGTYKLVGDTFVRNKETGEDQRFQFVVPQAKMSTEQTITLEADGDPTVFSFSMKVLRPEDGIMMKLIQYDVVENEEENDGSTMVKNTENLNLLDDAEMYKVSADADDAELIIGATEY